MRGHMLQIFDKFTFEASDSDLTPEGFLKKNAKIARSGLYEYYAYECGELFADYDPLRVVVVFRPPEEVFSEDSMNSFANKSVTLDHPWEPVTASNVKDVQVGISGDKFTREGDHVAGMLIIQDADAVNTVQRGEGELSAGYNCQLFRETGEHEGVQYDAVMRNIVGNHIALVKAGRCGESCKIGDRKPIMSKSNLNDCSCQEQQNMSQQTTSLTTIAYDGFKGQTDENGQQIFSKMEGQIKTLSDSNSALQGQIDAKDTAHAKEIADKDAKIKELEDGKLTEEQIDKMVADRQELADKAKPFLAKDYDLSGKSSHQIKLDAVKNTLGADKVSSEDETYIAAAFDTMSVTHKGNTSHDSFQQKVIDNQNNNGGQTHQTADSARAERDKRLTGGWKN